MSKVTIRSPNGSRILLQREKKACKWIDMEIEEGPSEVYIDVPMPIEAVCVALKQFENATIPMYQLRYKDLSVETPNATVLDLEAFKFADLVDLPPVLTRISRKILAHLFKHIKLGRPDVLEANYDVTLLERLVHHTPGVAVTGYWFNALQSATEQQTVTNRIHLLLDFVENNSVQMGDVLISKNKNLMHIAIKKKNWEAIQAIYSTIVSLGWAQRYEDVYGQSPWRFCKECPAVAKRLAATFPKEYQNRKEAPKIAATKERI